MLITSTGGGWISGIKTHGKDVLRIRMGSGYLKTSLIAAFAACLALVGFGLAEAAIFGKDNRTAVPQRYDKLKKGVGLLRTRGGRSTNECNAFCIAPDVVATSAHCLFFPVRTGHRPALSSLTFHKGDGKRRKTPPIAGVRDRSHHWNVIAGATYGSDTDNWIIAHDWALVKLAKPACGDDLLPVVEKKKWNDLFDDVLNSRIFIIFHNRRGRRVRMHYAASCKVPNNPLELGLQWVAIDLGSSDPHHLIPHRCDFKRGASGSPLLLETPKGSAVIGINAAESDFKALKKSLGERVARQLAANFAVSSGAFRKQIELIRNLPEPLGEEDLTHMQSLLKANGDYSGDLDGEYGNLTRQAILDFERRHNLLATGRPTKPLLQALESSDRAPAKARNAVVRYFLKLGGNRYRALAVDPDSGASGASRGNINDPATAIAAALAVCGQGGGGRSCVPFALGSEIVFGKTQSEIDALIEAATTGFIRTPPSP